METNFGKVYFYDAKFENNKGNDVTIVEEELFGTNKEEFCRHHFIQIQHSL